MEPVCPIISTKMESEKIKELYTKHMRQMMDSCYCYGGIGRDSYNFSEYILKYKEHLGEELFDKVYKEEEERLSHFEVVHGTYTDGEGLSYSSLKPKEDAG